MTEIHIVLHDCTIDDLKSETLVNAEELAQKFHAHTLDIRILDPQEEIYIPI